jgi:hypothetical protein
MQAKKDGTLSFFQFFGDDNSFVFVDQLHQIHAFGQI